MAKGVIDSLRCIDAIKHHSFPVEKVNSIQLENIKTLTDKLESVAKDLEPDWIEKGCLWVSEDATREVKQLTKHQAARLIGGIAKRVQQYQNPYFRR